MIIILVIIIIIVDQDLAAPREGRVQELRPGAKVGGDVTTQRVPQTETLQQQFITPRENPRRRSVGPEPRIFEWGFKRNQPKS